MKTLLSRKDFQLQGLLLIIQLMKFSRTISIMIIIGVIIIIILGDQLIVGINILGLIAVKRRENRAHTEFYNGGLCIIA